MAVADGLQALAGTPASAEGAGTTTTTIPLLRILAPEVPTGETQRGQLEVGQALRLQGAADHKSLDGDLGSGLDWGQGGLLGTLPAGGLELKPAITTQPGQVVIRPEAAVSPSSLARWDRSQDRLADPTLALALAPLSPQHLTQAQEWAVQAEDSSGQISEFES